MFFYKANKKIRRTTIYSRSPPLPPRGWRGLTRGKTGEEIELGAKNIHEKIPIQFGDTGPLRNGQFLQKLVSRGWRETPLACRTSDLTVEARIVGLLAHGSLLRLLMTARTSTGGRSAYYPDQFSCCFEAVLLVTAVSDGVLVFD